MKKILMLTAAYDEPHRTMGSAPKMARQLAKHANVVVVSGGTSDRVEQRTKNLKVIFIKEWLIRDTVNNGIVFGMMRKLRNIVDEEKPDAILNLKFMFWMNLAGPLLKKKGYRLVTATDAFPGIDWFSNVWYTNIVMWLAARLTGKWILKKSDKVVLFHGALRKTAEKLGLDYTVIPNGVEFETMRAAKARKLKGKTNIIFQSRLEAVKGYQYFFQAAKKLVDKYKDVHVYHIADLEGKEDFVAQYKHPQIHFEGRMPLKDVYTYMKGGDIVVLSSITEGLPNAIMEGMAAGCAPVSTPVGAVPELFEGGIGLTFEYADVEGLFKQLEYLHKNPAKRKQLSKLAKKRIEEDYNWETLSKKYIEVVCAE